MKIGEDERVGDVVLVNRRAQRFFTLNFEPFQAVLVRSGQQSVGELLHVLCFARVDKAENLQHDVAVDVLDFHARPFVLEHLVLEHGLEHFRAGAEDGLVHGELAVTADERDVGVHGIFQ